MEKPLNALVGSDLSCQYAEPVQGAPLGLFEGFGIELEYIIVDQQSLDVRPIADLILRDENGACTGSLETGELGWSNELVAHVLELKTKRPVRSLQGVPSQAWRDITSINRQLAAVGATLLPTAMHPWMNPLKETQLWPHECGEVYQAFNRVFGCQGHGWSNLQSMHLNLPFANDLEFARLHAAIRLVLPLLPALAASSPIMDGKSTGCLDNRLAVYRQNCARIPSITGRVIPEAIFSRADYEKLILQRLYRDIEPFDPEGVLQDEWLNARGAIARFSRQTIEIRVLDIQECPEADLAIAFITIETIRALCQEKWSTLAAQQDFFEVELEPIFLDAMTRGGEAVIHNVRYLAMFGLHTSRTLAVQDVWRHLQASLAPDTQSSPSIWKPSLEIILREGCLASRVMKACGSQPTKDRLHTIYMEIAQCLASNRMFRP